MSIAATIVGFLVGWFVMDIVKILGNRLKKETKTTWDTLVILGCSVFIYTLMLTTLAVIVDISRSFLP